MRARLVANAQGKLTAEQRRDLVTEPLTPLLILLIPGVILGSNLLGRALLGRTLVLIVLGVLVIFAVPMVIRAWRYSNPDIQSAVLYTGANGVDRWLFWRAEVLYTDKGDPMKFRRRVAPITILKPNSAYRVYYLDEPVGLVLLSIAPVDHPDAPTWTS